MDKGLHYDYIAFLAVRLLAISQTENYFSFLLNGFDYSAIQLFIFTFIPLIKLSEIKLH